MKRKIVVNQCVCVFASMLLGLVATPVWAANETVSVPAPNGTDDTAALQAALDRCVALGSGCTVQLAAGRYKTRQLVAYNFRGELRGRGKEETVIEALPNLHVDFLRLGIDGLVWPPDPVAHPWPSLILFVDGDICISDLSIQIPSVPSTEPYDIGVGVPFWVLIDAIRFMGQHPTNATVQRVSIEGREDPGDTGFFGFNVANGISYLGELPTGSDIPFDYYRISGQLKVTASSVRRAASGVYPGVVKNARVTIGGSPSDGNVFENVAIGTDLESLESSVVEVSHNSVLGATLAAAWAIPWCCGYLPQKPSLFSIHDNTLRPTGEFADGVLLFDDPARPWIHALVFDNTIDAQDVGFGGISAYNTRATSIRNNRISGRGADGIGLWNSTHGVVLANDVEGLAASSAQIVLDGTTSRTTVVCESSADTVLDQGPANKLIGCQEVAAP